jgi:hypothetical protein
VTLTETKPVKEAHMTANAGSYTIDAPAFKPLVIDTGEPAFDPRCLVPDWFQDICAADISTEKLFHDYAYHLIGATTGPVKMATVRDHALAQWRFLRHLADMHPTIFDEFWTAYAERAMRFE